MTVIRLQICWASNSTQIISLVMKWSRWVVSVSMSTERDELKLDLYLQMHGSSFEFLFLF